MSASFHFDLCSILLTGVLLIAMFTRKLYKGRTNLVFFVLVVSVFLTAFFDFVAICLSSPARITTTSLGLRACIDYLFFICRNITAPIYIAYLASLMGVWYLIKTKRFLAILWTIPFVVDVIALIINSFTGLVFYYDSDGVYNRGPLMTVLYFIAFYYVICSMIVLIYFRRLVDRDKNVMLLLFLPINGISVVFGLFNPDLRLDIVISAIYTVVVAVSVQRPEEYFDYVTYTQSANSFKNEVKMASMAESPLCIVVYKFVNYKSLRASIGLEKNTYMLKVIADKFKQVNDIMRTRADIFYLDNGTFAVVSPYSYVERMADMGRMLLAYTAEPIKIDKMEVLLESKACILNFDRDIKTVDSLLTFVNEIENMIPGVDYLVDIEKMAATKEFKMKNDMNVIIERGILYKKFQMYYQPIYSIKEKKFVSAEALIRLIDSEYGFVSPGLFIPMSEKTGAIHQIGDYVFKDVCRFMDTDEYKSLDMDYIEINLSVAQCIEYDLVDRIERLIKKTNVSPKQINLEITETAVDYDPSITDSNISKLDEMGFTFSLDDYGTGYSNIRRVVSLPISLVKIDKSLVDEMDNPQMWTVITNTVNMLKNMNKEILVEGVEDARTVEKFTELGCDYIQGFYFSKPLPEKDFVEFIKKANA